MAAGTQEPSFARAVARAVALPGRPPARPPAAVRFPHSTVAWLLHPGRTCRRRRLLPCGSRVSRKRAVAARLTPLHEPTRRGVRRRATPPLRRCPAKHNDCLCQHGVAGKHGKAHQAARALGRVCCSAPVLRRAGGAADAARGSERHGCLEATPAPTVRLQLLTCCAWVESLRQAQLHPRYGAVHACWQPAGLPLHMHPAGPAFSRTVSSPLGQVPFLKWKHPLSPVLPPPPPLLPYHGCSPLPAAAPASMSLPRPQHFEPQHQAPIAETVTPAIETTERAQPGQCARTPCQHHAPRMATCLPPNPHPHPSVPRMPSWPDVYSPSGTFGCLMVGRKMLPSSSGALSFCAWEERVRSARPCSLEARRKPYTCVARPPPLAHLAAPKGSQDLPSSPPRACRRQGSASRSS